MYSPLDRYSELFFFPPQPPRPGGFGSFFPPSRETKGPFFLGGGGGVSGFFPSSEELAFFFLKETGGFVENPNLENPPPFFSGGGGRFFEQRKPRPFFPFSCVCGWPGFRPSFFGPETYGGFFSSIARSMLFAFPRVPFFFQHQIRSPGPTLLSHFSTIPLTSYNGLGSDPFPPFFSPFQKSLFG